MNNDNSTTKPTIETVLERVNELGEQINNQLTGLRTGQAEMQTDIAELKAGQVEMRNDMAEFMSGQRKIRFKIEALNDNILTVQADLREDRHDFNSRLEKLESQQS